MTLATERHAAIPLGDCPDTELATLAAGGRSDAFELIMRRHNRLLFRTARSITRDDDEAQEVLQEAYLRAWAALDKFRAEARLSTWLVRIVVNEALGRRRQPQAQVLLMGAQFMGAGGAPAADTDTTMEDNPDTRPDTMAMRGQLRQLMELRIDALPQAFRTVFMLRAVEEMSVDEVAQVLQLPPATVRTRFFRARSILREGLAQDLDLATADAFAFAGARCDRIVSTVLAHLGR